jgi:hypothetical protein
MKSFVNSPKAFQRLFLCLSLLFVTAGFYVKANESVVFNKVVSSTSATTNTVNNVQNVSGTNFKFTSRNATFALSKTNNDVNGTLTYYNSSNVLVSVAGTIKGKTNGTTSLYFENTAETSFYLLVVPGNESNADFVTDADPNFNNSGPYDALNTLFKTQSAASSSSSNSKSVVVSLDNPAGVTESNTAYIVYTLSFSGSRSASSQTVSFSPSITAVSATSGSDYTNSIEYSTTSSTSGFTSVSSSVSVAYNVNTVYLRVPLKDDLLPESNETINLSTGAFSGAGIGELANDQTGAVGTGTILDDSDPYLWTGTTNTTWSTATNWNAGTTPGSGDNAKIPSGISNYPALGANASVNSIEIVSGASLNTSGFKLTVNGNLTNNGSISGTEGSGKLSMAGASAQTISGTGSIDNLEISNSSGVSIVSGNTLTINQGFYPVSGILTTNGGLVMNSDANGTASIFQKASCSTYISGNVTLRRYINPNNNSSYRFIGNPFADNTKTLSSFTNLPLTYAYKYDTTNPNPNPTNSTGDPAWARLSSSSIFEQNKGIITFVNSAASAFTIEANGPLHQCDVQIQLSSYSNNDANKGYVLLSNPYAAFLNLSANPSGSRSNVQSGFYIWDTATSEADGTSQKSAQSGYNAKGKYKTIIPGGGGNDATLVPPMGAFLVKLTTATTQQTGTITFKETEKANTRNVQYYTPFAIKPIPGIGNTNPTMNRTIEKPALPFYYLKLIHKGREIDDFKLIFREEASNEYDIWDLTKMPNSSLDLYSKMPNSTYSFAVDSRSNNFESFEIPIFIKAKESIANETFEFKWEHVNQVDADFYLEDFITKEKYKLTNGQLYSFKAEVSSSEELPRFKLYVVKKGNTDDRDVSVFPNPATKYINIQSNEKLNGDYTIEIFDASGFKVNESIKNFRKNFIPSISTESLSPGNYFIHIKNATGATFTKKLIIK